MNVKFKIQWERAFGRGGSARGDSWKCYLKWSIAEERSNGGLLGDRNL
jgi:hypothetical protein